MNQTITKSGFVVMLMFVLSACSTHQVKEPQTPAQSSREVSAAPASKSASSEASPVPTAQAPVSTTNPLQDPASLLSKRTIHFDYDRYEVKPEYRDLVAAHAGYLVNNPRAIVILEGNADDRGSREYNLALGQKRAEAVKKVMNVHGVSDRQIETISYGEEWPVADGQDEASWAKNRRVNLRYAGE